MGKEGPQQKIAVRVADQDLKYFAHCATPLLSDGDISYSKF